MHCAWRGFDECNSVDDVDAGHVDNEIRSHVITLIMVSEIICSEDITINNVIGRSYY